VGVSIGATAVVGAHLVRYVLAAEGFLCLRQSIWLSHRFPTYFEKERVLRPQMGPQMEWHTHALDRVLLVEGVRFAYL
jgi:hypothetical protein